ncbi:MAG: periplasmic heavy metal sensor [Candidatus Geothermincolia bacterium]
MKRCLQVVLVFLTVAPVVASAQMMGGAMSGGGAPPPASAQQETAPPMPASGMSSGMMGQGMMSGMMCQGKEMMGGGMMQGGMMSPEMMGPMMSSMMDGMMSGKMRSCMMMAEGMMKGQMDMAQMHKALALSDEQTEKLRVSLRPFQKEAILTLASMKVAELELTDLLGGEKVDFGKVEAKLKEIEAMRTKVRLAHLKVAETVKGVLNKEQLEKLQGAVESTPTPPTPASTAVPQKGATPGTGPEHEQHH